MYVKKKEKCHLNTIEIHYFAIVFQKMTDKHGKRIVVQLG